MSDARQDLKLAAHGDPEILRAEADVDRAREVVLVKVMALQREIARTFDWREWVRARPLLAVVAAFSMGALLGGWRLDRQRNHR